MIGSPNITMMCRDGLKSLENPVIANIRPQIRGSVMGIFHRIGTTNLYPMSQIEMDKNMIFRLEHSAKTPEEKELLKRASLVVYLAEQNAQARNLKRAKNGEPPEEVDSEEDEDYGKECEQRELTAEENEYLLSNRHVYIHPRILCRANSIFTRLFRKPDISLSEVKKLELGLCGLSMSCKTSEEKELVSRASSAVWKARQYAGQRALERAKHPKGQDEEEDELQNVDNWERFKSRVEVDNWADAQEIPQAQEERRITSDFSLNNWSEVQPFEVETQGNNYFVDNWGQADSAPPSWANVGNGNSFVDNWTAVPSFEVESKTQPRGEANNWGHAKYGAEIQREDSFVDNWAEVKPFEVNSVKSRSSDTSVDSWAHPKPFVVEAKTQNEEIYVDNWTAHEAHLKQQRIIPDLERKLLDSEDRALDLAEELRASKEREEQMKKDAEEMKRSLTSKCHSLKTQLDEAIHNLQEQTRLSNLLIEEDKFTTETFEKSRKKEAELQRTVKVLKAELEKSKGSLRGQQDNFNKTVHILAREIEKSRSIIEKQEKRIMELEQKVAEQEVNAASVENQPTFFETIFRG